MPYRRLFAYTALMAITLLAACGEDKKSQPKNTGPHEINAETQTWIERNNIFSLKLFKQIAKEPGKDTNILVAGPGVSTIGSMLWLGSAGATKTQLANALFGDTDIDGESLCAFYQSQTANSTDNIKAANAIWIDDKQVDMNPDYTEKLAACMHTKPETLTGTALADATKINNWAEKHTDRMITDLIDPSDLNHAVIVLSNALLFDGQWEHAFDSGQTTKEPFSLRNIQFNERTIQFNQRTRLTNVNLMSDVGNHYQYTENNRWQVLSIPFKNNTQSMVLLLPQACEPVYTPRCQLEEQLHDTNSQDLLDLVKQLQPLPANTKVQLKLPRFSFDNEHALIEPLNNMGIKDLFDAQTSDLSPMINMTTTTATNKPYVSVFKQKSRIKLDEKGAKAAAATAAVIGLTSMPASPQQPKVIDFIANHPFMFMILDDQQQILFIGRFSDPQTP